MTGVPHERCHRHWDYVQVQSKYLTGFFRVYSLEIDGDNMGGAWQCKARVLEVTDEQSVWGVRGAGEEDHQRHAFPGPHLCAWENRVLRREHLPSTVLPSMKIKKPNGEMLDYPQITGVPVVFPQSSAQVSRLLPSEGRGWMSHPVCGAGP